MNVAVADNRQYRDTHTGVIAFSHDSHSGHQCDIIMVAVNVQSSDEY